MPRALFLPLVLVLALATGAVALAAGAVLGSAPSPARRDGANDAVIRRFYAALNVAIETGNAAALDALLAPDFVDHPAPADGASARTAVLLSVLALHTANPDLHVEVETVAADGDTVTVRSRLHRAEIEEIEGAPATAATDPTAVTGRLDVFRVEGGAIVEHWGISDGGARCGAPIDQGAGLPAAGSGSLVAALAADGPVLAGRGDQPHVRWQLDGAAISADPVVANGTVYAAGWSGVLVARDAATGSERWRFAAGDQILAPPVVGEGTVHVVTISGSVHALDAATGQARWRARAAGIVGRGLALADGTLYLATGTAPTPAVGDGVVYAARGETGAIIQAFDAGTGAERWRFYLTDQALYAFETATFQTRWQLPLQGEPVSAPLLADGAVYVVVENLYREGAVNVAADHLYRIDNATGQVQWRIEGEAGVRSFQAIGEGVVYQSDSDGQLRAIDGETGVERWVVDTGDVVVSAPVVAGGVVYVGSRDGHLYAVDAPSGSACGRFALGDITVTPAVADGIAYVGMIDGRLAAVSVGSLL